MWFSATIIPLVLATCSFTKSLVSRDVAFDWYNVRAPHTLTATLRRLIPICLAHSVNESVLDALFYGIPVF